LTFYLELQMILFDIFLKRGKFTEIYNRCWQALNPYLEFSADPEDEVARHGERFFFVSMVYGVVHQAALAAGMKEDAARHLARAQTRKCPLESELLEQVCRLIAIPETSNEQQFGDLLDTRLAVLAGAATSSGFDPGADDYGALVAELREAAISVCGQP
jgi:hypothetical protein